MYYENLKIPSQDHEVEILFYKAKSKYRPVIFEMHGGGFMFGSATSDAIMCHRLRNELDVNVISIEYTLTTKAPYPTQLNEVYDVMTYVYEHATMFECDKEKFITFGHSAGANLATAVCLKAQEKGLFSILLSVLDYPYLDLETDPFQKEWIEKSIAPKFMEMFRNHYTTPDHYSDPLISPVKASFEQMTKMPPTIIVLAEKDNLSIEGKVYANKLIDAYVDVHVKYAKNKEHTFIEKYFSASRVIYTRYTEEKIFIWIKGLIQYYINRPF